jgi:beta-fructofuranosidase
VNGAIDDKQIYHHQAFRDPEVFWNAKDRVWWLLLHAMLADGSSPAFARYTSSDLKMWAPAKPLVVFSKTSSGDCPNIFPLNDRWYLLSAEHHYTSASNVEGPYPTEMATYDCGELFVPKALYDGKRRIIAGWIGDHEGHRDNGKGVWGGVMSMPREIYADNQGQLRQRPLHEIIEAFGRVVPGTPTEPKSGVAVPAPGNFMLHCTVTAQTSAAKLVIAMRQAAADASSGYRLTLDFSAKQIALSDATRNYSQPCAIDKGAPVDVRIFAEGSVLECFINDAYCFTMRAFDRADGAASFVYSDAEMLVRDLSVKALVEGTK